MYGIRIYRIIKIILDWLSRRAALQLLEENRLFHERYWSGFQYIGRKVFAGRNENRYVKRQCRNQKARRKGMVLFYIFPTGLIVNSDIGSIAYIHAEF